MKSIGSVLVLLFATTFLVIATEKSIVVSSGSFDSEKKTRQTLGELFPNLDFGFYFWTGDIIIGVLEDFDYNRVLLIAPDGVSGTVEIIKNGKAQKLSSAKPVSIKIANDEQVYLRDKAEGYHIGHWVDLKSTDTYRLKLDLTYPCKGQFQADYDPDAKWKTSCKWAVADQYKREPADVYEISRDSMMKQIRSVLESKDTCVVRTRLRSDVVFKRNKNQKSELLPMTLVLDKNIAMKRGEEKEVLTLPHLIDRVDSYQNAAFAGGEWPRILLKIKKGCNDKMFRELIRSVANNFRGKLFIEFE